MWTNDKLRVLWVGENDLTIAEADSRPSGDIWKNENDSNNQIVMEMS